MADSKLSEEKERARATWDAGDFPAVARLITSAGELTADRAKLTGDDEVLDVACGSGNATLPAARTGAKVTGLDLTPSLLEAGRRDAEAEGLEIEWVEGDAEALPFEDASFDAALSIFGIMFAPDHQRAADEIARVLRPGGRLVVSSWRPDGSVGRFFGLIAKHMPPPPDGFQPPILWGTRDHVSELFDGSGIELDFEDAEVVWHFDSVDEVAEMFETKFGPVMMAKAALEPEGKWDAAIADLRAMWKEYEAADGTVSYAGEFLVAKGLKKG
jgi:SAM-dependent methyltransferase